MNFTLDALKVTIKTDFCCFAAVSVFEQAVGSSRLIHSLIAQNTAGLGGFRIND